MLCRESILSRDWLPITAHAIGQDVYVKSVAIGFYCCGFDVYGNTALAELTARTAERYFLRNYVKLLRQYGRYVRYVRYVRMETRHY